MKNKAEQSPVFSAAIKQEAADAKRWYREHKHELPAAVPYDSYSEAVQRAIKRALKSAKSIATRDGAETEERTETDDSEENRCAFERMVEGTRFDRTGEKFKELGSGLDESLTRAIERLAGGRYAEAIDAYFRRKDGETCREIAGSYYIRDGKTGLQVHPWPGTVRRWIDRVETWINSLTEKHGLVGERKAEFLFGLHQELSGRNKERQWGRLHSELGGQVSSPFSPW